MNIFGYASRIVRSPAVLLLFTLFVTIGMLALRSVPVNLILSGQMTALEFFRLPIAQFYLAILFLWVQVLQQWHILPLLLALATLGVLDVSIPNIVIPGKARLRYMLAVLAELTLLGFALRMLFVPARHFAVSIALILALVFLLLRLTLHRAQQHRHVA